MRVLIFTSQFTEIGGIERLAVELAVELNRQGIHTDILSMYSGDLSNVKEKSNEIIAMGVPNIYFLNLKIHPSPAEIIKGIFRLNKLVRKNKYDIVETSALTPIVISTFGLRFTKCKQIAGIHQVFIKERDNLFQHKILKASIAFNNKIRYYGISEYTIDYWISYSKISKDHIRCIYNSISNDFFEINERKHNLHEIIGLPKNAKIIIYVGRIIEPKRPIQILDAISDICELKNLAVLFLGRIDSTVIGTNEMVSEMKRIISEKKLNNRIKFLGASSEVPQIMASSDLMVHPTKIEAFGLVLAEAMASGLQIVATNVEGIPEVLANTDNIMVDVDNSDLLRSAILNVLDRTLEEKDIAIFKGKKRAELFKTELRAKQMIKLFDDVISKNF